MMILIENLIDDETLTKLRTWLAEAVFEDGRATAGGNAAKVKNNEQVSSDPDNEDPKLDEMQDLMIDKFYDNVLLDAAAMPKYIHPPLFSKYGVGKSYGIHMDNATMDEKRVDMSVTLFLTDPDTYEGGDLVIHFPTGEQRVKLKAGHAVLYPTQALHQVTEVTKGERLVVVTWIRSFVRDPAKRELLFDLKTAHYRLSDQLGKTVDVDMLSKTYTNLYRRWVED